MYFFNYLLYMQIIDSHIHSGIINVDNGFKKINFFLKKANINSACVMPPVEDVYDRYNKKFYDNENWIQTRINANNYVLSLKEDYNVYPIYFVWNDFNFQHLVKGFYAVKWHRHQDEPAYDYQSKKCEKFLNVVYEKKLPIILEETFENTLYLIKRINRRTNIIIPHLGALNGGFARLFNNGIWNHENVYADSALASIEQIKKFLNKYSCDKLLFGSDYPFSTPQRELSKIQEIPLKPGEKEKILSLNVLKLYNIY